MRLRRPLAIALSCTLGVVATIAALEPGATRAAQLRASAALTPDRLGAAATVAVGFEVTDPPGEDPQPVTELELSLPAGLSIATSELGLQTCQRLALELQGPSACPPNSKIGHGSAVAEVPFGLQTVSEHVAITLFSAPLRDGLPQLLVYASGLHPVIANLVFPGTVKSAQRPFGAVIDTSMPLVPALPEGPDVALVSMSTTIGPAGIVYRETVHGRTIRFHPAGIVLPTRCPQGGFHFAVTLGFQDGTEATDDAIVPCPVTSRGR